MRIEKWIDIAQEIEFDLSVEDIKFVFSQAEGVSHLLYNLNQVAVFLKGLPQEKIAEIKPGSRAEIYILLIEAAERFK